MFPALNKSRKLRGKEHSRVERKGVQTSQCSEAIEYYGVVGREEQQKVDIMSNKENTRE
jgi:hypothetical protein